MLGAVRTVAVFCKEPAVGIPNGSAVAHSHLFAERDENVLAVNSPVCMAHRIGTAWSQVAARRHHCLLDGAIVFEFYDRTGRGY